jgi:hypothetical protein
MGNTQPTSGARGGVNTGLLASCCVNNQQNNQQQDQPEGKETYHSKKQKYREQAKRQ